MSHLSYFAVLTFVAICAFGINLGFGLHIGKHWKELLLTQMAIVIIYLSWDAWAIAKHNWFFDVRQIVNVYVLPKVPLEELLFFIVVPLTTILSYQALLKLTGWNEKGRRN